MHGGPGPIVLALSQTLPVHRKFPLIWRPPCLMRYGQGMNACKGAAVRTTPSSSSGS